jgi:hypothetical protein
LEQLENDLLVNVTMECFDLGIVLLNNRGMSSLVPFDEFEDIVELDIVVKAGEDFDGPKRPIAIVAAVFQVRAMLQFLLFGEV